MLEGSWNRGNGKAAAWLHEHATYASDYCLIFPFYRDPNGYGMLGYEGKNHYAHRFMCALVNGPPPTDKHEAAHSCGNGGGGCANPKHLSWKTKSGNRQDSIEHGMGVRNTRGNSRKLTDDQLKEIHALRGLKTQVEIGEMFGMSAQSIRAIFTGTMYAGKSKINHWTPEEDARLRDALNRGYDFRRAAKFVGRSRGSTKTRTYRLGLKSGRPPDPKKDRSAPPLLS